ncbi:hypothetical protein ABZT06_21005 [Streptomyces sp. NPDC005483]
MPEKDFLDVDQERARRSLPKGQAQLVSRRTRICGSMPACL